MSSAQKMELMNSLKTEQERLLAQQKALESQQSKAEAQQKLLELEKTKAKEVEENLVKAREAMQKKELALDQATKEIDQHKMLLENAKIEQQKLKALSEQQKLDLQQKLKSQQELVKAEQLKLQNLAEQQSKELEKNLLQEKLKSQETQTQLMQALLQKEQDQKNLLTTVKLQEQQVALAELKQQHLQEVLNLTRQQMADEQNLSTAVAKIEDRIVEQKGAMQEALKEVTQNQQSLNQNMDSLKKKSTHEIFQMANSRALSVEVKYSKQGLFGLSQNTKTFYALPIKFSDGSIRLVSHYMQTPWAWDSLDGDLTQLEIVGAMAPLMSKINLARENPKICFSEVMPVDTLAVELQSDPQASERIIVVDLEKKAYASFPLRWQSDRKDKLQIEAALASQVFGPLSLAPGQLIFADDGRWIGFVLQGKEGFAVSQLTPRESFSIADLETWRQERQRREAWITELDPRRLSPNR